MAIKNLPTDINAEVLLEYYPKETFEKSRDKSIKYIYYNNISNIWKKNK